MYLEKIDNHIRMFYTIAVYRRRSTDCKFCDKPIESLFVTKIGHKRGTDLSVGVLGLSICESCENEFIRKGIL